jgi:pyruvate-formate lyase
MVEIALESPQYKIKQSKNLSPRIQWLRDYYFEGVNRKWNNEYTSWGTGTPWDFQYEELSFYIVPETYAFFSTFRASYNQTATKIDLHPDFWSWSIAERKAWFLIQVMVHHLPQEILPGDLIAGARFNVMISTCLNKKEAAQYNKRVHGKNGSRESILWFHNHGYGNVGATSGHIIPDYETVLTRGWECIYNDLEGYYQALSPAEQNSAKGAQMRAMMTAATLPKELAGAYSKKCSQLAEACDDPARKEELLQMADTLQKVPWKPAESFWEAVQSLWLTHMLVMSDENYPGPGVSFGRIDQLLYPMWQTSIQNGMDPETGKEILKCFWIHANTAYDGMIRTGGNQGITAGYGQLFTLSGLGADNADMTNDLTYIFLEVIDEMSPILEPKPNVRIHRNSPDELMDTLVEMVADSQGAPFILNFDERSMAGMLLQAEKANLQHLIHENNVFEYAPVGCLENTMVGNDRSGTVDNNLNLLKAVELALTGGYDILPFVDSLTGKSDPVKRDGPNTGDSSDFKTWNDFWQAYVTQTRYIIKKIVDTYEYSESIRKQFSPTPYLSCMVKNCAQKGLDVTQGGADISLTTIEGVTFATTVDALLAIKYLVYDQKICTMLELIQALKDNWVGHEVLQARALNKAPKYGRDDDNADAMAQEVMQIWTDETWKHRTKSTNRQFRPGMLSWNYWVSDGFILPASADGRPKGKFLSNALCPSNGADTNGPTANVNSVGKALAGKLSEAFPNWQGFINLLPNGGSHTMTFNPSLMRDPEHKTKFKAFLRAYAENGGTALQINILDAEMLRDAQRHPENYRNLLVRVTGYNAYFTSIGKELQEEIIARETHQL